MDRFFSDLAQVYREEIRGLTELSCTYLQLDHPNMAYPCDEKMRKSVRNIGEDPKPVAAHVCQTN
jgi:5-methyltetrahydropteroyltriglutamate--homocysteine methyltransferase